MNRTDAIWAVGRATIGTAVKLVAPLRSTARNGSRRRRASSSPSNHFSWIDPPALGAATARARSTSWRRSRRIASPASASSCARSAPSPVRRGESDRDAVRTMRQIVRDGHALGLFVEGTRQRTASRAPCSRGRDGRDHRGRARDPAAIYGSYDWRLGNFRPVSLAWGEPMTSTGFRAAARATRRRPSRSSARSGALGVARRGARARPPARRDSAATWHARPRTGSRSPARSRSSASRTSASRRSSTG